MKMRSASHFEVCLSAFLPLAGCGHSDDQTRQSETQTLLGCTSTPSYTFEPIDFPGAQQTVPVALNSDGVVAGWYIDAINHNHGFT